MNDALYIRILLENSMGIIKYAKINVIILYFFSGDPFHTFENTGLTPAVIIYRNNFIAIFHKVNDRMRSYIATSACHQDLIHAAKKTNNTQPQISGMKNLNKKRNDEVNDRCKNRAYRYCQDPCP